MWQYRRVGVMAAALGALVVAGWGALATPGPVEAHSASGESLMVINGKHTVENPVAKASTDAAEDLAPESYVVNHPVSFRVDEDNFGQSAEFRWVWSEGSGQHDDDPAATHTFTKPGSYKVELQARFGTNTSYTEAGTVMVNVLPAADYSLPKVTVEVTPQTLIEGFKVKFEAKATHDRTAKVVSYVWDFGDGATADGRSVEHVYKNRDFAATPYVKVTDSNNLVSEAAFNLHNQGAAVVISDLEGMTGVASLSHQANAVAWWTLALTLVGLAVVTAGAYVHRKRRRRRKHS